ncbi:IS30 family transposase [Lactiplantibacillus pentosus]
MTQNKNTTSRTYQQLQPCEQGEIMALHNENWPASQIAKKLHHDRSTITRELQRNTTRQIGANHKPYQAYYTETAQILHNDRRAACHAVSWTDKAPEFFDYLTKELHRKPQIQSVDSCVHTYKMAWPDRPCPSTPTVYRYIDAGLLDVTNGDLPMKLRRHVKSGRKTHQRKNKRALGKSIEDRPAAANDRTETGHWEGDLVKGKRVASEPALLTLTERVSRYEIIIKIVNYHADTCRQAVQDAIDDYGPKHFKTLTFDNGSEFADLSKVEGTTVYFAHPYSPWERGTNENQNQLSSEFIPKGKSMKSLILPVIQAIQDALNQRPHEILGYKSAMDILPNFD